MIRYLQLLLLITLSTIPMSLYAYEVNGISYDYSFSNKTAAVRSVYATGHINIPSSIYVETYYSDGTVAQSGTLSVVSIGEYAFGNRTGITKVTIPNSVTSIDGLAFYGCTDLTSIVVAGGNPNFDSRNNCNAIIATASNTLICGCKNTTIPNSVTSIGYRAFSGCSGLTSVTIPNSVTSIDDSAFSGCSGLTSVTIPNSVTSIGYNAFRGCSGLTSVTIPNSVTTIGSSAFWGCTGLTNLILEDRENAIFGLEFPDSPIETLYLGRMQIPGLGKYKILKTVIIGGKVTSIVDNAFSGCSGLTSVTIPNSVTSIGDYAFSGCSGLTSVTIPNLVATIGKSAFSGCSGLTSVTIPNSVTTIGRSAFRGCTGLNEVNYNAENCTSMGEWVYSVFEGCSNLVSINIGSNTKTIPECAFKDCISLTEVTIPNSVTEIGGNAFAYCIGLTNLILEDGEEAISGLSFPDSPLETVYLGRTTSDAFASRKTTLKTLTIGDKVTSIANSAFYGCSGLTGDLTIPNSVTSIGKYAFYVFNGCNGLTSLTIGNSVTSIGESAFEDCSGLTGDLTIPNSVITIGESAFWGCSGLTNLILEDGEDAISGLSFPDSPLETIYLGRTTSNAFARGKTTLKTLTIGDKVTSITNNAFNGCSGLTGDLTIPNSVTSIGEYAFHNCSGLNGNLTLGNSVATIGKYTFSGCNGLTGDLTIPNSVTSIGEYAFHNCSDLNGNLALGNSVATIGKYAFSGCSGLTGSLTIPNSVTEIAECTFSGCSGLISVTIPSSVLEILGAAFNDCTSLSDLIIEDGGNTLSLEPIVSQRLSDLKGQGTFYDSPLTTLYVGRNLSYGTLSAAGNSPFAGQKELVSVTIGKSVTSIRDKMFLGCSGLTNLEIPNSVTTIGESAFYGCIGMEEITIGNSVTSIGYNAFRGCSGLTSVTIPNSVTTIGSSAFWGCTGLTSLTIGNSVTSIGESAFEDCSGLSNLILEDGEETISELYFPDSPLETLYLGRTTFDSFAKGKTTLKTLTIGDKVTSITNNAFNSCSGLTGDLTIPNSVTSIGEYAFHNCSGLNGNLTLGNSVATIGRYAFRGCSGLIGDLTIPNSVTSVGESAFLGCSGLNGDLTLGNSVATIGRDAFLGCSGLTGSLTIPNSVTEIAESAFNGCSGLTGDFTIPNSVTSIGDYAFNNCGGLTSVTIPNSVTTIGSYAFNRCSGLTNLILEDGEDAISGLSFPDSPLETIYLGRTTSNAFASGKTTLKTLTIGDKVTSITNNAFNGCSGLTGDLIILNSVTSIGESAFSGCSGLTGDLIIPNSVTEIDWGVFFGCSGLTSVTIPNSITSIGGNAFNNCSGLTSVTIPNSVTTIGSYAFNRCSGLTSVTIPNSVTSIGGYAFSGCSGLANLILEDGEDAISGLSFPGSPLETIYLGRTTSNAFASGKTTLKTLTIGDKVTSITNNAFNGCSGLTGDLIIPNSVTSIGEYAFNNCSGLNGNLTLGNSVATIGRNAFYGCSGLTGDLTIPNSVTSIGYSAFSGCSGLTNLEIPNSVTTIGESAFYGCIGMEEITIGNSVTSIGSYTFYNCSGLTSVTIPNSVTSIGSGAFSGCSGLTSVTIPNSITSIDNYAFGNCSGLAKVYCAAATPPDAYYGAFSYQYTTIDGAKAQTQLYVPASSVDLYKSTSPWSNFLIGQYGELKLYKSSYYTFDNYYIEDKTYKSMNGVTADGTSQIFIPIEEDLSPSDFSIILTINGEPASIETAGYANQTIQKMPNGEKGIIYTAPKTFDESCMSNSYIVELTFDMINENGLTNIGRMPIEIEVHRPGLLMVHGLNSSSECWLAMQNDLLQSGLYRSAQINNINYSSSNLSSFDYNTHEAKVLEKGVKSMHNNLINNGIVSSKYDMIGHSMGGVLIRKYAQEVDGAADMVNSIITVNTPHHGSQLANIGMYVERIGSNYLSFLKPFIDYVTLQSAIYDLQIDGAAIKKLNQKNCSGIPVHVISSTIEDIDELYSRDIRQENVNYSSEDISNSLGNIIEVIEAPTEGNMKGALENFYKLIYSDKSDGIVSLSSQQGGLSGLCATNNIGQIDFSLPAPMWSWAHHCLNTKWDVTMNDIKALLCASKQGNGFTTGGFKYPLSAYSNTSDLGSLTFAEPQAGSFIKLSSLNTSDLQEVKVTVSDDVVSHCVYYILDNKLVSALDCDTARFIMPHWYEGGVTYYSLAKTNYGALITDSIYVDVKATDVDGNYLIYTPEELTEFAKIVNSDSNHTSYNAKLMADIDLENAYWTPICETGLYYKSYGEDLGYSGTFDGNGHVIRNLKVKSSTIAEASYGLFGTVSGTIKNLGIDGFKFEDGGKDFRAGAIVGQLITNGGKVSNCYVKNATIAPRDHVCGGIAGCAYEATIENCYVTNSTIIGYNKRYGHIVGDTRGDNSTSDRKGYVNNCYTDNSIVYSAQSGNISNCKQVDSEQFANGEVAYLLQGEQAEQIWGQNIDNGEEVQLLPTLYGAKVYYGYKDIEGTNTLVYTNDSTISENAPVFTQWKYYYNDTNWENSTVYTYVWDASNGNKEYLGSWPGTPMQKNEEGMWEISFETTDSLVDPMVIFSNGYSGSSNQTADLILINNEIYNFSGYTDITGIDVPHNPIMKIDVVNSMIIVTAERDDIVSITSTDGRTRFYEVKMGKNYISDLPKGFYIVNKTKVVL